MPEVALVTCSELPEASSDSRLVIEPLAKLGIRATAAVWDDRSVDWDCFDLAVIRSCWDYVPRRAEFVQWARSVPRLANPADVIEWNTDKRYLRELETAGVPTVPTNWVKPGDDWQPGSSGECVVKPVVSMSSLDTGRYRLWDETERALAGEHAQRLLNAGRDVMVQPYVEAIDTEGETAVIFVGGVFSHAVKKHAILRGPDTGDDHRLDENGAVDGMPQGPSADQLRLAERSIAGAPHSRDLMYARVDMVPGLDGLPMLIELELTEPQLYHRQAPGSAERFALAIADRLRMSGA